MRIPALILAACAAGTLNWSGAAHSRSAAHATAAEQRLAHISIQAIGKGSPVVLIPGLSTPRDVWSGIAPKLARDHRVILVQINGFAGDDPGANLQSGVVSGAVEDLHAYLASQKLGPARVIGHSLGGLIALELAKAHPTGVSRLMIVDSLPYIGDIFAPNATVAQMEPQAKVIRDQMVGNFGKPDSAAAQRTAATLSLTPAARAKVQSWVEKADVRVAGEALYEDLTTDLRPQMAQIATPITLVFPYSSAMPKERAEPFYHGEYAKAPQVTFVPLADSGHFIMLDQPDRFAAAVADFLK